MENKNKLGYNIGNFNKENPLVKFHRLEKFREFFVIVLILIGLFIIQFPLPGPFGKEVTINKNGIYVVSLFLALFTFTWHRFKFLRANVETKFFVETLVYLLGIHTIIVFTGGTYSYFTFLYFLPVLNTAANLNLQLTLITSVFTSLLMGTHLYRFIGQSDFFNAFSIYFLDLFGIWLVTALGRFLATEILVIIKRQEEFELEQLRQLDKLKDEFVFIIAHELRSPITAIRGYLELISTDFGEKMDNEVKALIQKSFSTSNKLANIISLLLEVARIETGKIRFYLQKIDLKESVSFVVEELKKEADEKRIQLTIDIPKESYLMIDKERLEEILHIIIENAIFFTPEYGKILISTQTTEKHILVSISDTGVGIPQEMQDKIFDKLFTETTEKGEIRIKGYGISLYAAKQLLLRMDGDITFESIVGRGTTFTLHLPKFWVFG